MKHLRVICLKFCVISTERIRPILTLNEIDPSICFKADKAILVDIDEYAKELSRYIHLNPVRAKMVDRPEEYDWSSYKYCIGKQTRTPSWLHREKLKEIGLHFGIGESGVSKACRRVAHKIEKDKRLKKRLRG